MSLYTVTPQAKIADLVAALLLADPDLAGFFGARISVATEEEATSPITEPTLQVVGLEDEAREIRPGGNIRCLVPILIRAYLPVATPALRYLTIPSAPTAGAHVTGTLTGTRGYRLTEVTAEGQSFASSVLSVTVTSKYPVLTMPSPSSASVLGRIVWASPVGMTRYHWAAYVPRAESTWTDTLADADLGDDLAPDPTFRQALVGEIEQVIFANLPLVDGGVQYTHPTPIVTTIKPALNTRRNLMVYSTRIALMTEYGPVHQGVRVGGAL